MSRAPAPARFCEHCGLPVGAAAAERVVEGAPHSFCCLGCSIAWRLAGRGGREGGGGESAAFLARIGLGVALSMIVMAIAWVPYIEPRSATEEYRRFAPWAALFAATPVVLVLGIPYVWNAAGALRRGRIGADLLIGIGIFAAYGASILALASGRPDATYLDTAAGLATLVTVGRWLEATAKERAGRGLREFLSGAERPAVRLAPGRTLSNPGVEEGVRADALAVGDLVLVRPGARVPADGTIVEGRALVDEAALTGEPLPAIRRTGRRPGRARRPDGRSPSPPRRSRGEGTRLAAVAEVLARARAERSPVELLADRVSSIFVPVVVLLALGVLGRDLLAGDGLASAGLRALSVLVVACPCALGIATPLAVTAALGRLAERGILVRSGMALAALPRVRHVAFDKTGTLTEGRPEVASVDALDGEPEDRVLALAAAVESGSEHALARGIVRRGEESRRAPPRRAGPAGLAGPRGRGSRPGGARHRAARPRRAALLDRPVRRGPVGTRDGGPRRVRRSRAGRIRLTDRARPSAKSAIRALEAEGARVTILSGDAPSVVAAIAADLGLPADAALGGCFPDGKVEAIRAIRAKSGGPVAFVGDGLNDAPALAAADLGIAVGSGLDVVRDAADVSLLGDDLGRLPGLLRAARARAATARWNLFWAFAYNVAGVGWALVAHLPPLFAALAMVVSSLFVIGNSARLRARLADDLA